MKIGERIFLYRKQAGLSQEELADKLNVTRQSISLWETDQTMPSLDSLVVMAEIFNVGLDELCGTQHTSDTDSARAEENASPASPEPHDCLACAKTEYTLGLLKNINTIAYGKRFILLVVAVIISILAIVGVAISDADTMLLIIPIFLAVMFGALIIGFIILGKKRTAEFLKLNPSCVANIKFFQDFLEVDTSSDNAASTIKIDYCKIKKVINDEKYILIFCGSTIVPIEKTPDTDCELILKLLNVPVDENNTPKNKKIKILLLSMFIASLLSIFLAMMTSAICVQYALFPNFEFVFLEYMWIWLLFLPLPLCSAVLGLVFLAKKYKCKKNIIAGVIMCALLSVFGSFSFIYKDYNLHDFGYVKELEQTAMIDLPDSGYISRAKNINSTVKTVAMIKFDDLYALWDLVRTDERFSRYNGVTSFKGLAIDLPSGYTYYWICDTTELIPGVTYERHGKHHCIAFAYCAYGNYLFVVEFLYEP